MTRRTWMAHSALVLAALSATFVAPAFGESKDIKIAHIYGKTGPLEAYGKQTAVGFMMGLDYATGGTMMAGKKLLEKLGAHVMEGAAIVDLPELGGSDKLRACGLPLFTLLDFAGH